MNPTTIVSRPRQRTAAPAAMAILYPQVGNVLRVPLRRTYSAGPGGCEQHPERQFITWFNRMAAARPGFPRQIKSILLITGEPLCDSCHRALASYLSRYQLAGKLRLRSLPPAVAGCGCGCGGSCGTQTVGISSLVPGPLLIDELLNEVMVPRQSVRARPAAGNRKMSSADYRNPSPQPSDGQEIRRKAEEFRKLRYDAYERRRKKGLVPKDSPNPFAPYPTVPSLAANPGGKQGEWEGNRFLDNPFSREFEQELNFMVGGAKKGKPNRSRFGRTILGTVLGAVVGATTPEAIEKNPNQPAPLVDLAVDAMQRREEKQKRNRDRINDSLSRKNRN